jgi:hypothetical protein
MLILVPDCEFSARLVIVRRLLARQQDFEFCEPRHVVPILLEGAMLLETRTRPDAGLMTHH